MTVAGVTAAAMVMGIAMAVLAFVVVVAYVCSYIDNALNSTFAFASIIGVVMFLFLAVVFSQAPL